MQKFLTSDHSLSTKLAAKGWGNLGPILTHLAVSPRAEFFTMCNRTIVLVCLDQIWCQNLVYKLSEKQGPKVGQNLKSGSFETFGSHFCQHFAIFEYWFYFQKCSPWWALSALAILGWGVEGVLLRTAGWTDIAALQSDMENHGKARLKIDVKYKNVFWQLHISVKLLALCPKRRKLNTNKNLFVCLFFFHWEMQEIERLNQFGLSVIQLNTGDKNLDFTSYIYVTSTRFDRAPSMSNWSTFVTVVTYRSICAQLFSLPHFERET